MWESLAEVGSLTSAPGIYAVVAVSVLLDVFLPILPSGVLVIAAATAAAAGSAAGTAAGAGAAAQGDVPDVLFLILSAATASVVGDLVAYRLAWRGGPRLDRALARSRRLRTAQERLGAALAQGGGALVILARFAPAGRSVVSFTAGVLHRRARDFLPWSALAGLSWAAFSTALGYFGAHWLGARWLATLVSFAALFVAGAGAGYLMRRGPVEA